MENSNRVIKFRAWDNKWKVMVTHFHVMSHDDDKSKLSFVTYPIEREDIPTSNQNLEGDYELMQYTGLKDKNGKEIYEGDVVEIGNKGMNDATDIAEIVYYRGGFMMKLKGYFGYRDIESYDGDCEKHKVIGNIKENPELLTANPKI